MGFALRSPFEFFEDISIDATDLTCPLVGIVPAHRRWAGLNGHLVDRKGRFKCNGTEVGLLLHDFRGHCRSVSRGAESLLEKTL